MYIIHSLNTRPREHRSCKPQQLALAHTLSHWVSVLFCGRWHATRMWSAQFKSWQTYLRKEHLSRSKQVTNDAHPLHNTYVHMYNLLYMHTVIYSTYAHTWTWGTINHIPHFTIPLYNTPPPPLLPWHRTTSPPGQPSWAVLQWHWEALGRLPCSLEPPPCPGPHTCPHPVCMQEIDVSGREWDSWEGPGTCVHTHVQENGFEV